MFTLGIVGGSGSGKSTLVEELRRRDIGPHLAVLPHDAYYHNLADMPAEWRDIQNWDHPDALDTALYVQHLDALRAGQVVFRPVYDFDQHQQSKLVVAVEPRPVLILEGILLFHVPEIRERLDLKVFIETPADLRLVRRIRRDVIERGRTVESVIQQYLTTVRPMHNQFVVPSKAYADVLLPWESHNAAAVDLLAAAIRDHLRIMKPV